MNEEELKEKVTILENEVTFLKLDLEAEKMVKRLYRFTTIGFVVYHIINLLLRGS